MWQPLQPLGSGPGTLKKTCLPRSASVRSALFSCRHGIGWVDDLQDEIGEGLHLRVGELALVATEQAWKGAIECLERRNFVQRITRWVVIPTGAIPAPVHRPGIRHTPQALRGHRALQGVKVVTRLVAPERIGVGYDIAIGIAEVPGQVVHIAEDVTRRA